MNLYEHHVLKMYLWDFFAFSVTRCLEQILQKKTGSNRKKSRIFVPTADKRSSSRITQGIQAVRFKE